MCEFVHVSVVTKMHILLYKSMHSLRPEAYVGPPIPSQLIFGGTILLL